MENRVWKVLIADDEPKVCELIKYLIPWKELSLELVAEVSNGLEAIEVLKEKQVDIILTDARMPECDGIELVKWCYQQKKPWKYIVISGYRHFEYAHGALQYGVDYYLLKPINQKELIRSLSKIIGKLEQDENIQRSNLEIQNQVNRNRDNLRRHFINSYIFDGRQFVDRQAESIEKINEEYQMQFADGIYQAIFVKIDNAANQGLSIEKLLQKVKEMADEHLKDFGNERIGTMVHSGIVFLMNYPEQDEIMFARMVENLYDKIDKMLDIFDKLRITIGISCREDSIKNISHCIATAGEAIKYRIYLQNKDIIIYDDYQYEMVPVEEIWTEDRKKVLESYVRAGNKDGMKKLLFECKLAVRQKKNINPTVVFEIVQEMSTTVMKVFNDTLEESEQGDMIFRIMDEKIDCAVKEDALWEAAEALFEQCVDVLGKELQWQQTKPIRMVKEYIESHYNEAITLDVVAEKVNLSANYVSAMFKKETGVTFLEYLTATRMEAATDLLRKTDLSINQIAEMVGYTDVKHFSKLCKKTLGMKPSEYRKLYS